MNTHGSLSGFKNYLSSPLQRLPYRVYDLLTLKSAARLADRIVVSSHQEHRDALDFGLPARKLHVIPMGIEVQSHNEYAGNPPDGPLRLLFVGRIARVRRVELILQAVQQLTRPFHLTVVGGEERTASVEKAGYLKELKALARSLGIHEQVSFTGPKAQDQLQSIYQNADVFLYPSLYENFAQPILEAAAYGLPVIATPVGVAREIVREGETGFLIDAQPKQIAERIESLSASSTRQAFGEKIKSVVREKFGWQEIMQRYLDLYHAL